MRYLFTFFFVFSSFIFLSAQNNGGCGAVRPASYQLTSSQAERMDYIANSSSRSAIRWIGIVYHIVTKDDGTGGIAIKDIFDTHCELNTVYNVFNIGFYISDIDTIMNTTLWEYQSSSLGYSAFSTYNVAKVCNVYLNGNLPGLCGFATFPQGTSNRQGGVFLNKDCVGAGTKTLPHEMGHYLNLAHTFETSGGVELVNGSNCATAGDGFCDTPADFVDYRAPCPYTGNQTDANGDFYKNVIDESLLMSYFNDNCVNRFSNEEEAEMNSTLTGRRSYLLNQPMPDTNPLDSAVFINPLNGDTTVNSAVVQFKWQAVARAQYYLFRVQSASSSVVVVDTLITDTAYTVYNLVPHKSYKFRVKAISYGNTCGDNAPYQFVQMAIIKTTLSIAAPSCPGNDDGSVSAVASNGVAPYSFLWSNGATGNVLSDVPAGTYSVTITDHNGEIAITSVQVREPAPLSVNIVKVGNNLTAFGSGGTPFYNYAWNNGVTGPGNNNITLGNYTVTITDSKGCSSTQNFILSALGVNMETKVTMKIFPNPASKVASFDLQVILNERTNASVALLNVTGETVLHIEKEFVSGINNVPVNIEQVASGIYFVQFKSNEVTKTERVSVIK